MKRTTTKRYDESVTNFITGKTTAEEFKATLDSEFTALPLTRLPNLRIVEEIQDSEESK